MVPDPLGVGPGLMVPQVAGAQAAPPCDSVHVTPLLAPSLPTVAVNAVKPATATFAVGGATERVIAGTVIVVDANFVASAAEVAVMVMLRLDGAAGGV